jgi:hypothetical protein
VEVLGFYHPAVWWVSYKIRTERENCCDDLAVSISGDRVCYARALTSMEEIRAGHGQLAVAASGGNLFRRIYRLLGKDSAEKTGFSWIPAATAILLILALVIPTALALTAKSNPQQAWPTTDVPVEGEEALEPVQIKELLEIEKRVESARKLSNLGKALLIYANDYDDKYPLSLRRLRDYLNLEEFNWALANIEYLAHGKTIAVRPDTVIAYDKILLTERKGTNVLYNDSNVEFVKPERLKELGISATEILIETKILLVSEDFLQSIGLDANSVDSSDAWSEHLVADIAAEPNAETYILILDELHISFLLKAVGAHKGAIVLAAPKVSTREGRTTEIGIMTEEYYVLGYTEPNDPSDKPVPKVDKVELGTRIWLKPELTPDNEKIKLDFKMEFRQLLDYEERKYKGKYIYLVPRAEVVSTKMPCLIRDGKTMLIGGQKITEKVSAAPILSKLSVIGELFRSRDKTREKRILLILVKPIINPQQKARKILPGQADSEEHIQSLASRLEEKLNRPAGTK